MTDRDTAAIQHLRDALSAGRHWYVPLLESIGMWESAEEEVDGRHYQYLIAGEACDWLLLAERLASEVAGLIPEEELTALLFHDRPPVDLSKLEFKKLIGAGKYQAYLNYLYGVLVEESLVLAVIDEVRKERRVVGLAAGEGIEEEAYRRIYEATESKLLADFRRERGYPRSRSTSLSEMKEFAYWRSKYRLKRADPARVASDIKKALARMHRMVRHKSP